MMLEEMVNDLHRAVRDLCAKGDRLHMLGMREAALAAFHEALELLPKPYLQSEESTWILLALGDTYMDMRRFESARNVFALAALAPGGTGNPIVHLRRGQAHLACGDAASARDELARALSSGGEEIFEGHPAEHLALARAAPHPDASGPQPVDRA